MKNLFAIIIISVLFSACSNSNHNEGTSASTTEQGLITDTASVGSVSPAQVQSLDTNGSLTTSGALNTASQKGASAGGLNPAHGEPGHICDIPVGAPLNSQPTPKNTPVTTASTPNAAPMQSPATVTPTATPVTTSPAAAVITAPGMNPPHGQPGHDCAIAVGAPLKKK